MGFAYASGNTWLAGDTTLVMIVLAFIASSQFALPLLSHQAPKRLPLALFATLLVGLAYGGSVRLIEWVMQPLQLMHPQPLNVFHVTGIMALTLAWLSMLFIKGSIKTDELPAWMLKIYVAALNASYPHPTTVTAHRNHYQYL